MLSRVANSIYWTNRYVERVESYASYIEVNFNLAMDLPPNLSEQWEPLLIATADDYLFYQYYEKPLREHVIHFMTFDKQNPNSIVSCVSEAREHARTVRETISREMWESINELFLRLKNINVARFQNLDYLQDFFQSIKKNCQFYHGTVDSTFTRNEAWHFGRLGRYVERADKTSRFLDVKYFSNKEAGLSASFETLMWMAVLKSVSAYNMYRQTHRALNPKNIVSFLILDKYCPRSITFCLRQAELSLYAILGGTPDRGYSNEAEKQMSKLRSEIEYLDDTEILKMGLHQFLDKFQIHNNGLDTAIYDLYFSLRPIRET